VFDADDAHRVVFEGRAVLCLHINACGHDRWIENGGSEVTHDDDDDIDENRRFSRMCHGWWWCAEIHLLIVAVYPRWKWFNDTHSAGGQGRNDRRLWDCIFVTHITTRREKGWTMVVAFVLA